MRRGRWRLIAAVVAAMVRPAWGQDVLPDNAFGIGAAYIYAGGDIGQARERQLRQALDLAGRGGHVRLWCHLADPAECGRGVRRAHELGLVPVVVLNDGGDGGAIFSDDGARRDYTTVARRITTYVAGLPRATNRMLFVELLNEVNYTDWWWSRVCDWRTRAREYAQFLAQTADAIRSLGDPRVQVLPAALSPLSDADPPSRGDETCDRGTDSSLPSAAFIEEMRAERPDVFTKLDGWSAHPYSAEVYGLCAGASCPAPVDDPLVRSYQEELRAAGLPPDFPVYLTEVGHFTGVPAERQRTADFFTRCATPWIGAYYEVWLGGGPYNNVKGIMGFVLPLPEAAGVSVFHWRDAVTQAPYPVYSQVRTLRTLWFGGTALAACPAGRNVTVVALNGPGNVGDWVGLYRADAPPEDGSWTYLIDWRYLSGTQAYPPAGQSYAEVQFTLPATAGAYHFRFFADDGTRLLATSQDIRVERRRR